MASFDAVIIGGGNLGLWTAYHLLRRGLKRIAVCERNWLGFGATSRSAGVVRQQGGSETAVKLGKWTRTLYLDLGAELGLDSGFTQCGYCVLAASEQEKETFQNLVVLRRRWGVENEWIDAEEGARRFPQLRWDRFLGATYTATDGWVHPPVVLRNIAFAVHRDPGATVYEQCPVENIARHGGQYTLHTPRGMLETERVVNAGGPRGARAIGAMLGINVPVLAARHQIVTFPTLPHDLPRPFPMFFALARGYYIRPEEQGALVGMSNPAERVDETGRFQIEFDWQFYEQMRLEWEAVFPALAGQSLARAWTGSIDFTPDHLPIIDQPLPGLYVVAAGGHGMMWGPALGLKTAELVTEGEVTELPLNELVLGRFTDDYVGHDTIALPFPAAP